MECNESTRLMIRPTYHAFGEQAESPPKQSWCQRLTLATLLAVPILGAVGASLATHGLVGGLVATSTLLTAATVGKVVHTVFASYRTHRLRVIFPVHVNNPHAPSLGCYTPADLRLSNHATESLEWKKELLLSAEKSIELSANFAGGEKFQEVLCIINERLQMCSTLKVHLLLSEDFLDTSDRTLLDDLQTAFPTRFHYLITNRVYKLLPAPCSEENHVKLLVVDEQYFVTGGTGIHHKMAREIAPLEAEPETMATSVIDRAIRDADLIGYGAVAQTMRNQFFELYAIWEYRMQGQSASRFFPVEGPRGHCTLFHEEEGLVRACSTKFIVSGPEHKNYNPIFCEKLEHVSQAQVEVRIANLLFNPNQALQQSLAERKRAGIKISGYINGKGAESSIGHIYYVLGSFSKRNYDLLTVAYEYRGKQQLYHKKVMTVDARITLIGSANLGIKSAACDYECACVVDDVRVAAIMNQALDADAAQSFAFEGPALNAYRPWRRTRGAVLTRLIGPFYG